MVSFIASFATSKIGADAQIIDPADRSILYPDVPELFELNIPDGNSLLLQHLNEINSSRDHTRALLRLASSFYGDALIAHSAGLDLGQLYSDSLDLIFRGLER